MLLLIIFALTFFIMTDLMPILKNKDWKLFWIYSALMAAVVVMSSLLTADVQIPSPDKPVEKLIEYIFGIKNG